MTVPSFQRDYNMAVDDAIRRTETFFPDRHTVAGYFRAGFSAAR
jgi:hypothetical protein